MKYLLLALILYVGYRIYKFSWRFHQAINDMRNGGGYAGGNDRKRQRPESSRSSKVYAKDVGEYVDFEEIDRVDEDAARSNREECSVYADDGDRVSDAEYEDIR